MPSDDSFLNEKNSRRRNLESNHIKFKRPLLKHAILQLPIPIAEAHARTSPKNGASAASNSWCRRIRSAKRFEPLIQHQTVCGNHLWTPGLHRQTQTSVRALQGIQKIYTMTNTRITQNDKPEVLRKNVDQNSKYSIEYTVLVTLDCIGVFLLIQYIDYCAAM